MSSLRTVARARNITLDDDWPHVAIVQCNTCGAAWRVNWKTGGGMYRRWWACPHGCNV